MPASNKNNWHYSLGIELLFWSGLAGSFLYIYIVHFDVPASVVIPHVSILVALYAGVASLRLLNWRCMPSDGSAKYVAAILIALPWLVVAIWYVLALIGLASWGRVTTWLLIKTYAFQSSHLMNVLELPSWLLFPAILVIVVLPIAGSYRWLVRSDWTCALIGRVSPSLAVLLPALLGAISAIQITQFIGFPPTSYQEPFSLSFFPSQGIKQNQSHSFGNTRILDSKEALARKAYQPAPVTSHRNVILIIGDALRADHMSLYGYHRPTTPALERLSLSGRMIAIDQTRSVCAESTCGLLALATSRPVAEMPSSPFTLHDVLRLHGYQVHMILGGDHTNFYGLKNAYGMVDSFHDGSDQKSRYMNDDLLILDRVSALPSHDSDRPAMFQFHLMSTHGLGVRHDAAQKFLPATNYYRWPIIGTPPAPTDIPKAINYYDNGMLQFDQTVDKLLSQLERKGYLRNALVIITGDHGESLGEHGRFSHSHQVYEGALNIPLIFIRYGYDGRSLKTSSFASQIDVAPTALNELGIPVPSIWKGTSLDIPAPPRLISFQQSVLSGLYDLRSPDRIVKYWKNISTGNEYAFDITSDPYERNNIIENASADDLRVWRRKVIAGSLITKDE